ncbi:MarR family winged helix-turn-helix transcriptional regulator [Microbacterium sp. A196]|uniref:MarR family winged helix-turn-helix transcriptional regulator n=1 Tax=unclassified Microbacterium TaxID=2609290 RepID=UPI003FCF8444
MAGHANDDMLRRPGHLVRRAQQVHSSLWSAMVSKDVTPTQYSAISVIAASEGVDQVTVSRGASLDTSTTGAVIERLVQRGWVRAAPDPSDRRRRILSLTDDGRRIHREVGTSADAMTVWMTECFDAAERDQFVGLLRRFVDHGESFGSVGVSAV